MAARRFLVFVAAALFVPATGVASRADYRGPIRFNRPVFANIRPQSIQQAPIAQSRIARENIRPARIVQPSITYAPIRQTPIRRETFRFDSSIFGNVPAGPPRERTSSYVPHSLRKPTRRQSLGW